MRIAEIGLGAGRLGKQRIGGEFAAAVEGDRPAGATRESAQHLADLPDQGSGPAARVGQQDGEPCLPLDHRGQVRPAVLLAEDQQVSLPVTESPAAGDLRGPVPDGAFGRHEGDPRLAAVAKPALAAGLRQQAVEIGIAALRAIDEAVDRLVAQCADAGTVQLQPAGDLLRRPAGLEPVDDEATQRLVPGQLASPPAALPGEVLGDEREVARFPS